MKKQKLSRKEMAETLGEVEDESSKCGNKPKPTSPPPGGGVGQWLCDHSISDWYWEEAGRLFKGGQWVAK